MSRRYWTKPKVKTILHGDKVAAKSLEKRARSYIGYLFDQLTPGQTFRTQRWINGDGTDIHVFVWRDVLGERATARITVPVEESIVPVTFEVEFKSGWFYVTSPITQDNTSPLNKIYPRNFNIETEEISYGPWGTSLQLARGFTPAVAPCNALITKHDSIMHNRGSMYSGSMRYVVQLLQGVGSRIPYNYQWCLTHGIFIAGDGSWWVIEINSGVGVTAWRLPILRETLTDDEYSRFGDKIEFIPSSSSVRTDERTLMSAEDLEDAYNGSPYYSEHGWAFSYDGSLAQCISITQPDDWKRATRWQIEISTDVSGHPDSAELSEVETTYLYGSRVDAPKYPHFSALGVSLLSYDLYYDELSSPPGDTEAPLDVFFQPGSLVPIVVRYSTYGTYSAAEEQDPTWPPPGVSTTCASGYVPSNNGISGVYHIGEWSESFSKTRRFEIDNGTNPITPVQVYAQINSGLINKVNWEKTGDYFYRNGSTTSTKTVFSEHWTCTQETRIGYTGQLVRNEVWAKPFFDRESMVIWAQYNETITIGSGQRMLSGHGAGTRYNNCTANTDCGPGVSGGRQYTYPYCSLTYNTTELGSTVEYLGWACYALEDWNEYSYSNLGCDGGIAYYQQGCATGELYRVSCPITSTFVPSSVETLSQNRELHIFINGSWETLESGGTYNVYDGWQEFIATPIYGSQLFFAYTDVFGNYAVSYADLNEGGIDELVLFGEDNYPVNENVAFTYGGWYGAP